MRVSRQFVLNKIFENEKIAVIRLKNSILVKKAEIEACREKVEYEKGSLLEEAQPSLLSISALRNTQMPHIVQFLGSFANDKSKAEYPHSFSRLSILPRSPYTEPEISECNEVTEKISIS